MKVSYYLVYGFRPVECYDNDNIDFVKFEFNTDNVNRITPEQFKKISKLYEDYIINAIKILNDKNLK